MIPENRPTTPDLLSVFVKTPNRNNPSIPPLKIEAYFHHISKTLLALTIASATHILRIAIIKELVYKKIMLFRSDLFFLNKRL